MYARKKSHGQWLIVNLLISLSIAGCGTPVIVRQSRVSYVPQGYMPDRKSVLEKYNAHVLAGTTDENNSVPTTNDTYAPDDLPFKDEWRWNRHSTDMPPKICLALSGGGIRSAAFSIGVMKGLQELSILQNIDVISAVSGGAYALSWYLAQHFHHKEGSALDKTLFEESSPEIQNLLAHTRLRTEADFISSSVLGLFGIIGNTFANGLFGLHQNTNPARYLYESRLEEVFMRSPHALFPTVPDITLYRLGSWGVEKPSRIPFFIIGATAHIDADGARHEGKVSNLSFEFTPLQYGSDAFGRYRYSDDEHASEQRKAQPNITLAKAVSISGAAFDATEVRGASLSRLLTIFNQDLGFYLPNPGLSPEVFKVQSGRIFPYYLFARGYRLDAYGTHIYLTDGAHSENLGAFALARRLCEEIIIVDAEHDPYYRYEGYFRLKEALKEEMHVSLSVSEIEKEHSSRSTFLPEEEFDCMKNEIEARTCEKRDPFIGKRWHAFAKVPVMEGEICCLPYPMRASRKLKVTYIKLAAWSLPPYNDGESAYKDAYGKYVGSATQECSNKYPEGQETQANNWERRLIKDYYKCIIAERRESNFYIPGRVSDPFPQQPTTDQNFSKTQFRAYVGLGRQIVIGPGNAILNRLKEKEPNK